MNQLFTNGACDIYAQALHDIYGYKVLNLLNRTGMLLHAFCVDDAGYFIDADGRHEDLEFLKQYIGKRKFWKIVEYSGERLEPEHYNDIYTEQNFALAYKLASSADLSSV